ncbi:MAG: GDSL-type esterase/lipase family protein [Bacteroidales bacterium]|nr:GDSL-type esterase/lipase family protein [Bacteroidales bacterium]
MRSNKHHIILATILFVVGSIGGWMIMSAFYPVNPKRPHQQSALKPIVVDTTYAFIQYDKNHLYIGHDSSQINRLCAQWQRLTHTHQGHINIMHIGSSHVQGGTLPHTIRYNILHAYPDLIASRGMLFPYSAARKCNNPYDYSVRRSHYLDLTRCVYKEPQEQLGLCGIAVTAVDSVATIGIRLKDEDLHYATDQVVILGHSRGGVTPLIELRGGQQIPSRIDSIHHRYYYHLAAPTDSFIIVLPCTAGQSFALTGVMLTNPQPGFSYHSIGVNGASLNDYLRCPDFSEDLTLINPDLVIFGIGINDAASRSFDTLTFRQQYQQLIDTIRSVNPNATFIFITNNDSYRRIKRGQYSVNTNGELARQVFYRLADANGGAVWDQFEVMGGLRSMNQWRIAKLAQNDRVHFTNMGYQLIGNLFTNALFETLQRYDDSHPFNPMNPFIPKSSNPKQLKVNSASYHPNANR